MSVPISVKINDKNKVIIPDKDIQPVVNCLLIELFCKQAAEKELVRSEKMILFFLVKDIPFQCVVIHKEQLSAFKEAVKMFNIAYHTTEYAFLPEMQVLFFKEADSVSFNEVIKNNDIEIIEDLGVVKSEEPGNEQHERAAMHYLTGDSLIDFQMLYVNYISDGGTPEECESYMKAVASGPLFDTLMQNSKINGIQFNGFKVNIDDSELRDLDPDSNMKGGFGTTNYFERAKQLKTQAANGPVRQ